jgi:hypothetical protein
MIAAPTAMAAPGCRVHEAPTKVTHRAPPTGLVSNMEVLRRPQRPDDLPDHDIARSPWRLLAIDYVRKLGEGPDGETYYLIPGSITYSHLSKTCLRRLSPGQRRLQRRAEREQRARSKVIGLGVFEYGRGGGGGGCCSDLHALLSNRTTMSIGDHRSTVTSLVPDGVASVTLRWHRGPERNVTVHDNFWLTTVPLSAPRAFPDSTIWRDAGGHLIRSFREPRGR